LQPDRVLAALEEVVPAFVVAQPLQREQGDLQLAAVTPDRVGERAGLHEFPHAHEVRHMVVEAEFLAQELGLGGEIHGGEHGLDLREARQLEIGADAGEVRAVEQQSPR
jgi:hypothetical protein